MQRSSAVRAQGTVGALAARTFRIAPRRLLVAVPDGRCWLTTVGSSGVAVLPVSPVAAKRSTLAASAVEGAIAAGLLRPGRAPASEPCTLLRYVRWLAGNYVFAGQTPGLFRRGAERLDAAGRTELAAFARRKAAEESGHAGLAYRDLEALGLPASEVIRLVAPPSATAFAEGFRSHIDSGEPIALFGFSYCLERMAVERDPSFIRTIESVCPPGARAFRFLKVHSTVGSDAGHVHEQLSMFESLTEPELATVARAAYETAVMLARQPEMDRALTDEEIARRLRRAGTGVSVAKAEAAATESRSGDRSASGEPAVVGGTSIGQGSCFEPQFVNTWGKQR